MDTGTIRDELVASIRLPVAEERRLTGGAVVALFAYGLWVGATAAALTYVVDFAGRSVTVDPWTTTTTVVFGVGVVLWLLAPAAVGTYAVSRGLTNVRGNIASWYRFNHPSLLVAPPLVVFAVLAGVGLSRGAVSEPLAVGLVVFGVFLLVRTVAYSYRVFRLSVPGLLLVFVFVSAVVVGAALLAGSATMAGRPALVGRVIDGVEGLVGIDLGWLTGTRTVASVRVHPLPALAAAVPAGLSVLYLAGQTLASVVARLRQPAVPRSKLRTGQRYPRFARPTTASGATQTAGGSGERETTDTTNTMNATDDPADGSAEETDWGPGDTRLFTTRKEGRWDGSDPFEESMDVTGSETAVVGSDETVTCPTCGERVSREADYTYCPACGTPLASPEV